MSNVANMKIIELLSIEACNILSYWHDSNSCKTNLQQEDMHSHLLSHTLEKRMETCTDLRQNQFYWEKSLAIACISNNVLQCMQMMNSLRLQSTNSKMLELGKLLWIYLAFAGCDYIMLCFAYGYVFIYTPRSPQVWTTRVT